jgi:hypothetical protein
VPVHSSGTWATLLVSVSSPQLNLYSFFFLSSKGYYVELMDREKECNSCHVYCNTKGWFQKCHEIFKMILKRV